MNETRFEFLVNKLVKESVPASSNVWPTAFDLDFDGDWWFTHVYSGAKYGPFGREDDAMRMAMVYYPGEFNA